MAHFAKIENNIVVEVIVVSNDVIDNQPFPLSEPIGIAFCKSLFGEDTEWLQTSYNNKFRFNYASIGYTYDPVRDAFIAPQPYPSWTLDETIMKWVSPIPYPTDGQLYIWNEETQTWVLLN